MCNPDLVKDYYSYYAIFTAQSGDQYKTELMANNEEEAIQEAWDAFNARLAGVQLEHVATGEIVNTCPIC